nr:hypothetical protein [Tanacetum cinerariifolium]
MTVEEVNSTAVKYGIPLNLHPRVPSSTMTMNELPKDTIAADMFEFLKFLMAGGVRIRRGTALRPNEVIAQHMTAPLQRKEKKGQDAPKKFAGKCPNTEGPSQRVKKKKTAPITLGLSEYEDFTSRTINAKTLHSTSPFNTVALDPEHIVSIFHSEVEGSNQALKSNENLDEEVSNVAENEDNEINSRQSDNHIKITSSRAGTHPSGVNINSLATVPGLEGEFLLHLPELLVGILFSLGTPLVIKILACAGREASLSENLMAMEKEKEDSLDKSKGQEERIKEMEEALAEKPNALNKTELSAAQVKRHLLSIVVKRLLSSFEYKKNLSQPFNLAIAIGWSKGMKANRTDEEVQAILATADNYDFDCSAMFHSSFEALFTKKYSYVEKVKEVYRLSLGDLQNIWPNSEGPTLGGGPLAD